MAVEAPLHHLTPLPCTDWTSVLASEYREQLLELLRQLPFHETQRFPPPKRAVGGLPFGHELRIARRFLQGRGSQLDPSAFSAAYRIGAPARLQNLYRGFVLGEALPASAWRDLIGPDLQTWAERGLLDAAPGNAWACGFRVFALGDVRVVTDPPLGPIRPRVHIGQDSLNLAQFLGANTTAGVGRHLDVGTGTGILLLAMSSRSASGVGIDINSRSVAVANFNLALNRRDRLQALERDAFASGAELGVFDLVTWNLPFVFMPERLEKENLDGYGGHLGIELTLRFIDRLPELLASAGRAMLLTCAPILRSGEDALATGLAELPGARRLDITRHTLQRFWNPEYQDLHDRHGVRHLESVILSIVPGTGVQRRIEPSRATRLSDGVRGLLYRARRRAG